MTQDFLPTAVTMVNATFTVLRVAANVPQFIAILRDPGGARAISVGSWSVFAMANGSNGIYAFVMAGDTLMCAINLASACSCGAIATLAWIRQHRARLSASCVTSSTCDGQRTSLASTFR